MFSYIKDLFYQILTDDNKQKGVWIKMEEL